MNGSRNLQHAFPPFALGLPSVYERAGFEVNPQIAARCLSTRSRSGSRGSTVKSNESCHSGIVRTDSSWSLPNIDTAPTTIEAAKRGASASTTSLIGALNYPPTPSESRASSLYSSRSRSGSLSESTNSGHRAGQTRIAGSASSLSSSSSSSGSNGLNKQRQKAPSPLHQVEKSNDEGSSQGPSQGPDQGPVTTGLNTPDVSNTSDTLESDELYSEPQSVAHSRPLPDNDEIVPKSSERPRKDITAYDTPNINVQSTPLEDTSLEGQQSQISPADSMDLSSSTGAHNNHAYSDSSGATSFEFSDDVKDRNAQQNTDLLRVPMRPTENRFSTTSSIYSVDNKADAESSELSELPADVNENVRSYQNAPGVPHVPQVPQIPLTVPSMAPVAPLRPQSPSLPQRSASPRLAPNGMGDSAYPRYPTPPIEGRPGNAHIQQVPQLPNGSHPMHPMHQMHPAQQQMYPVQQPQMSQPPRPAHPPRQSSQISMHGVPAHVPRGRRGIAPAHSMTANGSLGLDDNVAPPVHYRPPPQMMPGNPAGDHQFNQYQGGMPRGKSNSPVPEPSQQLSLQTQVPRLRKKPSIPMPSQIKSEKAAEAFYSPVSDHVPSPQMNVGPQMVISPQGMSPRQGMIPAHYQDPHQRQWSPANQMPHPAHYHAPPQQRRQQAPHAGPRPGPYPGPQSYEAPRNLAGSAPVPAPGPVQPQAQQQAQQQGREYVAQSTQKNQPPYPLDSGDEREEREEQTNQRSKSTRRTDPYNAAVHAENDMPAISGTCSNPNKFRESRWANWNKSPETGNHAFAEAVDVASIPDTSRVIRPEFDYPSTNTVNNDSEEYPLKLTAKQYGSQEDFFRVSKDEENIAEIQADTSLESLASSEMNQSKLSQATPRDNKNKVCRGCEGAIVGKSIRSKDGNLSGRWHRSCFRCTRCASQLDNEVYVKDDEPFCQLCYHVVNKSVCRMCGGGVEGQCLETRAEGNDGSATLYHANCLRCVECDVRLNQSYFEVDGATYCAEHAFHSLPPDAQRQARFTRFIMI